MSDRYKKIYLIVMVVVPFLIYCGYYYSEMIRKAPYKFGDFRTITIDFNAPDGRETHIDIGTGTVIYARPGEQPLKDTISFGAEELREFHRNLYTNNFFDMPHEMKNEGSTDPSTGMYVIKAIYTGKQYKVVYETNYRGNKRYKDKLGRIIAYIESNVKKKL